MTAEAKTVQGKTAGDGPADMVPERGLRIMPVTLDDMREIYEVLTMLEPDATARLAETGIGSRQMATLYQATEKMESALAENDLEGWAMADDRFHRLMADYQDNRRLGAFIKTLLDQIHPARMATLRHRDRPIRSTLEHRAVLQAIEDGLVENARTMFRAHRIRAAGELLRVLEQNQLTL